MASGVGHGRETCAPASLQKCDCHCATAGASVARAKKLEQYITSKYAADALSLDACETTCINTVSAVAGLCHFHMSPVGVKQALLGMSPNWTNTNENGRETARPKNPRSVPAQRSVTIGVNRAQVSLSIRNGDYGWPDWQQCHGSGHF